MIIDFLEGQWHRSRRVIAAHNHYILAHMQGYALLIPKHDSAYDRLLHYTEKVTVFYHNNPKPVSAKQNYRYIQKSEEVSKIFDDGRLFYKLSIEKKGKTVYAHGNHQCAQDTYKARYIIRHNDFQLTHTVTGPQKDYQIITDYTRTPPT